MKNSTLLQRMLEAAGVGKEAKADVQNVVAKAAETQVPNLAAEVASLKTELEAANARASALEAGIKSQVEAAAAVAEEAVTSLQGQVAILEAKLVASQEAEAAKTLATRVAKLQSAVGTAQASKLEGMVKSLSDVDFESMVSVLSAQAAAEGKSALFTEQGLAAEIDLSKVEEESEEMKLLRAKYPSAKSA